MSRLPLVRLVRPFPLLFFVGLILLFLPAPAAADGIIIPVPPPDRPISWRAVPLTIKYHRVTTAITDQVAITHVDQAFVNDAPYSVEGTYIFPLPE
ncbi:MAG: VIT domain-containing protein, partial [Anaerolineae bacterium]